MHCKVKGSDCGYLGLMDELMGTLPVERMAHNGNDESVIGAIEDVAGKASEYGPKLNCTNDFCGVVGYMLVRQLEINVRNEDK